MNLRDIILARAMGGGSGGSGGGGSASIDVTASPGQTIVVEEVDANGKPTKWKAADYQPRTHWSEETVGILVPHTVFKPILNPSLQMPVYMLPEFGLESGKTYTVIYDGVEYTCTAVSGALQGLDFVSIGNTYLANGTQTSEPFIVAKIPALGSTLVIDLIGGENHAIQINGEKTVYHTLPEYAPNEYWVNFMRTGIVGDDGNSIYHFSADWEELISAIKAGKNIYAKLETGGGDGSYSRQTYMLGFAELGITPTEDYHWCTDDLRFGVCHNNVNMCIGQTVFVKRFVDGTVTVE